MSTTTNRPLVRTHVAGVALTELAREFGTPTYVYDSAKIVQRLGELSSFDHVRYAQKACSNLAVLDLLKRHGALVDSVSYGELRRALDVGFEPAGDPPPVVYTADLFDVETLDLCTERGIHVNCGSPDMIDQYGRRSAGGKITLRINPGFGHGHSQKTNTGGEQSKHGIWHEQIDECIRLAHRHGLTITGLHMHIGSGTDLAHLSQVCGAMERAGRTVGPTVTCVSAGGGLPIPYQDDEAEVDLAAYYRLWDETRRNLVEAFGHPIRLEIEPGRFLAAEAGFLVCEIRAVKRMGDNTFYLVDAGFNNLARPILYGAYHPMSIVPNDGDVKRPTQPVVVGGPLCESGDIFTQEEGGFVRHRELPKAGVGDLLVVECAGAYGAVMGSNYNSKPLAAEVLISDGAAQLIRARQTYEDMVRGEQIPPS